MYNGIDVELAPFYLRRGNKILCRGNELLCHGHDVFCSGDEIFMSWQRGGMSQE